MASNENGTDLSQDDTGTIEETLGRNIVTTNFCQSCSFYWPDICISRHRYEFIVISLSGVVFRLEDTLLGGNMGWVEELQGGILHAIVGGFSNVHSHELLKSNGSTSCLQSYSNITPNDKDSDLRVCKSWNVIRGYSAIDLVTMCKRQKGDNMNFQYDFKMDGHNRLEHVAWSYASSVQLYEAFGDAVVFDTSHIWILMICSLAFGLD
ncbi:hypothetical protein ACOSQ3_007417 [Xanthoceras sorbifolium]